jgi:hypothetical protein
MLQFWFSVPEHLPIPLLTCYEFLCEHILIFTEGLDFEVSSFGC